MRSDLTGWTLLLSCLFLTLCLSAQPSTTLTFFVEHEVEPEKNYLQMVLNIKSQDTSLKEALTSAADTVANVRTLAEEYCKTHSRNAGECQEITESGKFNVEPIYRLIRQEPVFIAFAVTYQVTAKILQTVNVGKLVDKISRREGNHIESLEWRALEEEDEEIAAVGEGVEEAEKRCNNLGLVLGEIVSIDEVADFELQEEEGDEEEEEQEEEEEAEVVVYKFVVNCVGKASKTSKKKASK